MSKNILTLLSILNDTISRIVQYFFYFNFDDFFTFNFNDFDTTNNGSACLNSRLNRQVTGFCSNATMAQIIHSHKTSFLNQKYLKLSLNKLNKRRRDVQQRRLAIQSTVTSFSEMTPGEQNETLICALMCNCMNLMPKIKF